MILKLPLVSRSNMLHGSGEGLTAENFEFLQDHIQANVDGMDRVADLVLFLGQK